MALLGALIDLDDQNSGLSEQNITCHVEDSGADGNMKLRKNRPLGFHLRQIIAEKIPDLKHRSKRNLEFTKRFVKDLCLSLEHPLSPFSPLCQRRQGKKAYRLDQVDPDTFTLRIFLNAFLYQESFQVYSGAHNDVPPGRICYKLNPSMTCEEKMVIHQTWGPCIDHEGFLRPSLIATVLGAAIKLVIGNDVLDDNSTSSITSCDQFADGDIEIRLKTIDQDIKIVLKASIPGYTLPRGVHLQHAMPKKIPYSVLGKTQIDDIITKFDDGQSLWCADAVSTDTHACARMRRMAGKSWQIDLTKLFGMIQDSALKDLNFTEVFQDYIDLVQLLRDNYEDFAKVSLDLIKMVIIHEVKGGLANQGLDFEDGFLRVLRRIAARLVEGSCPHLFLPSSNMFSAFIPRDTNDVGVLLEQVIDEIIVDPVSAVRHCGCLDKCEEEEIKQREPTAGSN